MPLIPGTPRPASDIAVGHTVRLDGTDYLVCDRIAWTVEGDVELGLQAAGTHSAISRRFAEGDTIARVVMPGERL
jgi:hypothetical protein